MRRSQLLVLLLAGACAQQAPIEVTYVPQAPTPAAAGTPEQQAARRLDRSLNRQDRQDRVRSADPSAASAAGEPVPGTDLEIGGGDPGADTPQVSIPFR